MAIRVAVVGAGPVGLMALKNLKEEGFDVTGYDTRPYVGGLWKNSSDSSLSAAEGTIFNSSRYRSAISDFPFPEDTDDFPSAVQLHGYFESYCNHFGLRKHIHLDTRVKGARREGNEWVLEVEEKSGSDSISTRFDRFDKLLIATGTFVKPKYPALNGIDLFAGPHLHAINFQNPAQYKGKNVLLIGLHATAQDVAAALNGHASKLYIAHRNGLIMVSATCL
jgi:dimethylaniline monooxygenase (N-oxide forming)